MSIIYIMGDNNFMNEFERGREKESVCVCVCVRVCVHA